MNKQMIIGRLGADPDLRYTQNNTPVCNISVATSEKFKDSSGQQQEKTEWHKCVAWGRLAEVCSRYLVKGSKVFMEGPTETRSWEDKNGTTHYSKEIRVMSMEMLDSKPQTSEQQATPAGQSVAEKSNDVDDDLPF